jgi:hypothetical protein
MASCAKERAVAKTDAGGAGVMSSPSFPCRWCGAHLHTDENRTSPRGVRLPLQENNQVHNCSLNPNAWKFSNNYNNKTSSAKAVSKGDLRHAEQYEIIQTLRDQVNHANTRCRDYVLDLHVEKKQTTLDSNENEEVSK